MKIKYNFEATLEKNKKGEYIKLCLSKSIFMNSFICPKCSEHIDWTDYDDGSWQGECCGIKFVAEPALYEVSGKDIEDSFHKKE